ncbi:unnamed protein product [Adineta ricciae]|uniref:Uncharacterized protein n=1 Tax=Adineta ricciae TaxID=249248 RepID=A0A814F831_ADIRI|nr:unnamed protein product [Adineta ricciae]
MEYSAWKYVDNDKQRKCSERLSCRCIIIVCVVFIVLILIAVAIVLIIKFVVLKSDSIPTLPETTTYYTDTSSTSLVTTEKPIVPTLTNASTATSSNGTLIGMTTATMYTGTSEMSSETSMTMFTSMVTTEMPVWSQLQNMTNARCQHTASVLSNSIVLVVGGQNNGTLLKSNEVYNFSTGSWNLSSNLIDGRYDHTVTKLPDGSILIVGGRGEINALKSVEKYNSTSAAWRSIQGMNIPRYGHTASVLEDGKILVAGGRNNADGVLDSCEIYNPNDETWQPTRGKMKNGRYSHAAIETKGGVIVVGGYGSDHLKTVEIYDPAQQSWSFVGNMNHSRIKPVLVSLNGGSVLAIGGSNDEPLASIELYDPNSSTWTMKENMSDPRDQHTASLLGDDIVLVAGGYRSKDSVLNSVELYNVSSDRWTLIENMTYARYGHTASILADGSVLIVGGCASEKNTLNTVELYNHNTTVLFSVLSEEGNTHKYRSLSIKKRKIYTFSFFFACIETIHQSSLKWLSRDEQIEEITLYLPSSCQYLRFSGVELSEKAVNFIGENLLLRGKSSNLQHLSLCNTKLTDEGITCLCHALINGKNCRLRSLDVQLNNFTDIGAHEIAKMLEVNKGLEMLDISYLQLTRDGIMVILTALVEKNRTLTTLDMTSSILIDENMKNLLKRIEDRVRVINAYYGYY